MINKIIPVIALLALSGCAIQTEAQIKAQLDHHIGENEASLIRELGVPTRSFQSGGQRFLAYYTGYQQVDNFGGFGGGFGGWGWRGGWGGWGGGWGPGGFNDWGPSNIISYGCETTYEVTGGHVMGWTRHGNDC